MIRSRALALVLLSGCAGGGLADPAAGPTTTQVDAAGSSYSLGTTRSNAVATYTIPAPVATVRDALPAVFEALQVPHGTIAGTASVYGTPAFRLRGSLAGQRPGNLLDCGKNPIGAPMADVGEIQASIQAAPQPAGELSTQLQIRIDATATSRTIGATSPCTSTGVLERWIVQQLRSRLNV
jgi:hypothetical protein